MLRGGEAAVKAFLASTPTQRLLWLLYEQHGAEADLPKDAFAAWELDVTLQSELARLVGGEIAPAAAPGILAPLIEPHLKRTAPENRRPLAEDVARTAARAAPGVVKTIAEASASIASRIERGNEGILAALGTRDREGALTRALVQGPLELTGKAAQAAEAERLADLGDHDAAAAAYLEVAEALDRHHLGVAAEVYRERAASQLYTAGEADPATALLVDVGRARARRGSDWTRSTVASLREGERAADAVSRGVEALYDWPFDPQGAMQSLRAAVEASAGAERIRWLADLVGLLSIFETAEVVLAAADGLDSPLVAGARLELELDLLAVVEQLEGLDAAEARWAALLDWVDTRAEPGARGFVWQRRGVCLARREDLPGAEMAFRKAMAHWAESSAGGEQVADALYSLQSGMALNGAFPGDQQERLLAAELRGPGDSDAARAEMLTQWGMRARLRAEHPRALRNYWHALAIARRTGSLAAYTEIAETLAELYAETGRHQMALSLAIAAGRGPRAAELARLLPGDAVAVTLRPHGARWERLATYSAVAASGRALPAEAANELLPLVLEASRQPNDGFAPPAMSARRALASLALFASGAIADEVFDQLRLELQGPPLDQRRDAAQALVLATNAGLVDATGDLIAAYVADPYNTRGVSHGWIKEQIETRPELAEPVRAKAVEGSERLLALLIDAGLADNDPELETACTADAEKTAQLETVRVGEGQISIGMGASFQYGGTAARLAAPDARAAVLARMLEMAADTRDSEENRAVATLAVDNLAAALTLEQARAAAEVLAPLSLGRYGLSSVDENLDDPLSPTKIILHVPNQLRAAAIATLSGLSAAHPELESGAIQEAVEGGFRAGPEIVTRACFGALAELPGVRSPVPVEHGLLSSDAGIRLAALAAWLARNDGLPSGEWLDRLLADPDVGVRWRLLTAASTDSRSGPAVLARFADDADIYMRLVAARRAREQNGDVRPQPDV